MRLPNNKSHALRYLILRYIFKIKDRIPSEIHKEITRSLDVKINGDSFIISWSHKNCFYEKEIDINKFNFFVRGDKIKESNNYHIDFEKNTSIAKSIVSEIIKNEHIEFKKYYDNKIVLNSLSYALFIFGSISFTIIGGLNQVLLSFIMVLLFFCELWYNKGRIFIPFLFCGFFYNQLFTTSFIGLTIFLIFLVLNPNKIYKLFTIFLTSILLSINIYYLITSDFNIYLNLEVVLITILALIAFVYNWVSGSHFQLFPLVFPFLSIGLYYDGYILFSMIILLISLISNYIKVNSRLEWSNPISNIFRKKFNV